MQSNQTLLRWAVGAILISLLLGAAVYWAVGLRAQSGLSSSQSGIGVDPLTDAEVALALASTQIGDTLTAEQVASRAPTEADAVQMPTQEVLLVERNATDKNKQGAQARQGVVYVYDYTSDELIHSVIDVATGDMIEQERVQGVQLPLTAAEEGRAIALAWDDAQTHQTLAAQFEQLTGQPLISLDQLHVKASVFLADSMPGRINAAAQACDIQRSRNCRF
ncbi:MAG: hypothetical protein R2911_00055 [Caldilineaceae bacterium]